ncbi:DUF3007 family protein [Calothrix sp. NIES-3974]|uniref:DUF3007 family protein n=1 Tax=Calothrix sp. NIES-3974 TaxID=2005462 RepID=UPI000B5F1726|nr:DUF3007 family protein [Calothrix sp. NIES-3974]BAZ03399.1 hypothetical protein NIES3974_00250 [Calothrix sp. NIES-3974]
MRRIDALLIVFGVFAAGGLIYIIFQGVGFDSQQAGIWSQFLLVLGLIGWLLTYVLRAVGNKMTYHEQRQRYEEEFLTKQLEQMSPEEIARLQAEIEAENN